MGRSQVLYNRTKGRYRNRGRGGRGGEASSSSSSALTMETSSNPPPIPQQPPPQSFPASTTITTTPAASHKKLHNERIVILEANVQPRYYSHNKTNNNNAAEDAVLSVGGSLDVPSLAATLQQSVKLSERLQLAPHVAHALVHGNGATAAPATASAVYREEDWGGIPTTTTTSGLLRTTAPSTTVRSNDNLDDDAASFSVAGERLRIAADGQVEVRPKTLDEGGTTTLANPVTTSRPSPLVIPEGDYQADEDEQEVEEDSTMLSAVSTITKPSPESAASGEDLDAWLDSVIS